MIIQLPFTSWHFFSFVKPMFIMHNKHTHNVFYSYTVYDYNALFIFPLKKLFKIVFTFRPKPPLFIWFDTSGKINSSQRLTQNPKVALWSTESQWVAVSSTHACPSVSGRNHELLLFFFSSQTISVPDSIVCCEGIFIDDHVWHKKTNLWDSRPLPAPDDPNNV